jgi:hypothetical protein
MIIANRNTKDINTAHVKAVFMNRAGHITTVRFMLSAMPIYLLIAVNVPKWFSKEIDKIRKGFLWKGKEQVNGDCCLVAWEKVMRPLDLGGLGIPNLEVMAWALQARWQCKKNPSQSTLDRS